MIRLNYFLGNALFLASNYLPIFVSLNNDRGRIGSLLKQNYIKILRL